MALKSVKTLLDQASAQLKDKVGDRALFEARLILAHVLGQTPENLIANDGREVSELQESEMQSLIERRQGYEPMAYLLGHKEFFGLDFMVNKSVLIPRPETEALVEIVSDWIKKNSAQKLVDLGTGSGCIAICLAKSFPSLEVTAVDISPEALMLAKQNADIHNCKNIEFVQQDILQAPLNREWDVMVSNPPYIPESEISELQVDVRDFEPEIALAAGDDGLKFYEAIFQHWLPKLKTGGFLVMETHDESQRQKIKELFEGRLTLTSKGCHIYSAAARQ